MQRTGWNTRLLASTRGRILALLRTGNRTVNELAAALGLTDNAVRAHLLSLERDRLVRQSGTRRGTRKPHATYGLSAGADYIFPKAYGTLLNHFLAVISNRLSSPMMRDVGQVLAGNYLDRLKGLSRPERIEVALGVLQDLGGSARFDKTGGKQFIYGHNGCPLAAVTAGHPDACLIAESLLSKIIGIRAKKCCEYVVRRAAVLS